jgi:hypothetical protein
MGKIATIQKERPDIITMMQTVATIPVEKQMKPFAINGFPNY